MDIQIGDIVGTKLYNDALIYKIVCLTGHYGNPACPRHSKCIPYVTDVCIQLLWKKHPAIAPMRRINFVIMVSVTDLMVPQDEILVLALAAK